MGDVSIKGKVKVVRTIFQAKDSDFKILAVEPVAMEEGHVDLHPSFNTFTVKGKAPNVNTSDTYTFIAKEVKDEKWGKQYELLYFGTPMKLDNPTSQQLFLSKILTETQYQSLYELFENPFEIIVNEDVESLTKANGIGVKTAIKIIDKYKNTIDYSEAYVELDEYGLTPRMIEKLVEAFGSPNIAVKRIKENPYLLASSVDGIGFKKADSIALKSGIHRDSPFRIEAFIEFFLEEKAQEGFSYYLASGQDGLMGAIMEILGTVDTSVLRETIHKMNREGKLWWDNDKKYFALKKYFNLEKWIAQELLRLLKGENNFIYDGWEDIIRETEEEQGWNYTGQQKLGVETVLKEQVVMITGYGGTGKSSIVSGMIDILHRRYNYTFGQCALSGRAGSRLAEVTGEEGFTIHRLLAYNPFEGFLYNKSCPLPQDIIIVDELSMVGGELFYYLIRAVKDGAKLIMLCDTGQLESIGMGNIAKDIIDSGIIPVVRLTEIHRQAKKSAIVTESLKVRESKHIIGSTFEGQEVRGELEDLLLDIVDNKEYVPYNIINHFKEQLPNVDSILDLQVVVPMKTRGGVCTFALNERMQSIYNPFSLNKNEVKVSLTKELKYILREGDKVLNNKNNYKTVNIHGEKVPVYNGNVGIIEEIDLEEGIIIVNFGTLGKIIVPSSSWRSLELAYAITCHKSQGSEYPITIVGLDYSAYKLLSREWFYTAMTRGKKKTIVVAEGSALRYAVSQSKVIVKQTFLKDFLILLEKGVDIDTDI